ncbi:Septin spn4, partial [Kickxella alabastrina]
LKPLDVRAMKAIGARVNLIPVIAKADTLSPAALRQFKKRVMDVIDAQSIRIYQPPVDSDDEYTMARNKDIISAVPFAIIGSVQEVKTQDGRMVRGRQYPWGVAEVENDQHCDFKKLRSLLIRTHMLDLISTTEEVHYDKYRTTQMKTRKFGEPKPRKADNKKFREEEEMLRKRFTEKVKLEENRFRQWEQKLIAERDRLNKDLEQEHNLVKQLESEIEAIASVNSPNGKFFRKRAPQSMALDTRIQRTYKGKIIKQRIERNQTSNVKRKFFKELKREGIDTNDMHRSKRNHVNQDADVDPAATADSAERSRPEHAPRPPRANPFQKLLKERDQVKQQREEERKRRDIEVRQNEQRRSKCMHVRKEERKKFTARTKRGQPVLSNQIGSLLDKIKRG